MHWTMKYLSIEYKDMNCSEFASHVLKDHFKKNYNFPQSEGSIFNQSAQIKESLPKFAYKTDTPKEGDLILMHGRRRMCHVGIAVKIGRSWYVLHTESSMKTAALHQINKVFFNGYTVEGFYTWLR